MGVDGSRVAVVGGSIAGCAAAIALRRAGCAVTVFERSQGVLRDRGAGLAIPTSLRDELISAGYIDRRMPVRDCDGIEWFAGDAGDDYGRLMQSTPFGAHYINWGVLWRALRDEVAGEGYRDSTVVREVGIDADSAVVTTDSGRERFDLVVGADGYRSVVRRLVDPRAEPGYVGYALWRGTYPEDRLPRADRRRLGNTGIVVCYPGGHGGCYLIPGFEPDRAMLNWVIYDPVTTFPPADRPTSLPPGSVDDELAAALDTLLTERYPRRWADLVRRTERAEIFLQPVYDMPIATYVADRALLIGDAATVVRPHTASGATKALQDAMALEVACRECETWPSVLTRYDAERSAAGNALVDLGRSLGRLRVEETPDWTAMSVPEFRAWLATTSDATMVPRYGS